MKQFMQVAAAVTGSVLTVASAHGQTADGWFGEGSFSAGNTTGNTETTDLGLGLKLGKEQGVWKYGVEALADYGELEDVEARNRWLLSGTVDRYINDRLFGFGNASYEVDEFSGYESRAFIGGGLGYKVLDGAKATWDVRGGPGFKIDEVRGIPCSAGDPAGASVQCAGVADPDAFLFEEATSEESLSGILASNYAYAFNDNVTFTNDTDVLAAEVSTQISNVTALTAKLSDALSARVSFDVRHDTEPPIGFEDTDTATKVAIVYGFGG